MLKFVSNKMGSALKYIAIGSAALVSIVIMALIGVVAARGATHISPSLFAPIYTSENASVVPAAINTLHVVLLATVAASILGVASAIWLVFYAKHKGLTAAVSSASDTLASIPSIVYGVAGFAIFGVALGWGYSLMSGVLTLATMILPSILRTTEIALRAVPKSLQEASLALGASRWTTIRRVTIISASPGIFNGIMLALGRALAESAALIYTAGTVARVPSNLLGSGRTLAVHLYCLWSEGLRVENAYACAVVLLILCLFVNIAGRLCFSPSRKISA